MGRKKTPTEIRELEGNPGKRPIPNSPKYPPLDSTPPDFLDPDGRELWERITTANGSNGVIQETDWSLLLAMCQWWQVYRDAMRDVVSVGIAVETRDNNKAVDSVRNPNLMAAQAAYDRYLVAAKCFGIGPTERARLEVKADDGAMDPVDALRRSTLKAV